MNKREWGFLRETKELAQAAGTDKDTGIKRTGLEEYLAVIFPDVKDWIHDKPIGKIETTVCRKRPDYRSEALKLIVEFDGLQHYTSPANIRRDIENTLLYESLGYKVVRIPYFIQLTNIAVKTLFCVSIEERLFDESIPSIGPKSQNTPAYLCYSGIQRMARDFSRFPEQYEVNMRYMKMCEDQFLVEYELLEAAYRNYIETGGNIENS